MTGSRILSSEERSIFASACGREFTPRCGGTDRSSLTGRSRQGCEHSLEVSAILPHLFGLEFERSRPADKFERTRNLLKIIRRNKSGRPVKPS